MDKHIRHFKILREIGKGGMGIVYKALDPRSQKAIAIKVLPAAKVDRSSVERFNREALAMSKLKHPNIIEVYDYGMEKGEHFFAMEYVEGDSLKSLIQKKGKLSVKETVQIVQQVAAALAYAHGEGMVHRDIKPGNIMVTQDGKVKVMDFGLVKLQDVTQLTMEGSVVGTAEYMSPEQISEEGVDTRTDIYSLGITLYEMLTGRLPFEAETIQALLRKHKSDAPLPLRNLNPAIPPELERIALKAMAKELGQRYQKAQELIHDLNNFGGIQPVTEETRLPDTEKITVKTTRDLHSHVSPVRESVREEKISKGSPWLAGLVVLGVLAGVGYFFRNDIGNVFKSRVSENDNDLILKTQESLKNMEIADEYYMRGFDYFNDGDIDLAIAEYKKAIQLRKDYGTYYKDLAAAYEKKNDSKNAIKAWQDLLKYDHSSVHADFARRQLEMLKSE